MTERSARPDVFVTAEMPAVDYTVHRLWTVEARHAFASYAGRDVPAIVTIGSAFEAAGVMWDQLKHNPNRHFAGVLLETPSDIGA